MSIYETISIIGTHFLLGLKGVLLLCSLLILCYGVIYKRIFNGKKELTLKQVILIMFIVGYIIMVLGVTIISRQVDVDVGGLNLYLFSTYKKAWNSFTVRDWQLIIFNIVMFVPVGILFPIFNEKFRKPYLIIGTGILFTGLIECIQFITHRGIFELDDLFNNILGTIIGYCLVMIALTLIKEKDHKFRKIALYFLPIFATMVVFAGIFIKYNLNEFGNLNGEYIHTIDLRNVEISLDTDLSNKPSIATVYKAPILDKKEAVNLANDFFTNLGLDVSNISNTEIDASTDEVYYCIKGDNTYSILINYKGGTYEYTDFSSLEDDIKRENCDEEELNEIIGKFGIDIPENAQMQSSKKGQYEWEIENYQEGSTLVDGTVFCEYFNDDTIKVIKNSIVTYKKVKETNIISEQQAYEELVAGKCRVWVKSGSLTSIVILDVKLDYELDSKGFFQPVYSFQVLVNGNENETHIMIPALDL
jgi:glycopeptide antibiotics resistance protein